MLSKLPARHPPASIEPVTFCRFLAGKAVGANSDSKFEITESSFRRRIYDNSIDDCSVDLKFTLEPYLKFGLFGRCEQRDGKQMQGNGFPCWHVFMQVRFFGCRLCLIGDMSNHV